MADWMVWLNKAGYIQVHCSECKHRLHSDEPFYPKCPKCGAVMYDEHEDESILTKIKRRLFI